MNTYTLAHDKLFDKYFAFGGVTMNRELFLNVSLDNFDDLFCDLAWLNNGQIVRHNELKPFIIDCIKDAARRLNLPVLLLN